MTDVLDFIDQQRPYREDIHDYDCMQSCLQPGTCFDCPYRFIEDPEDLDELISE